MSVKPSVVIRCLNEAQHLERLLSGICHQTVADADIIVVDSGSTDGTVEIARRFGARVTHIRPSDFSFGRSLNQGCRVANEEVLVFVSAHCYPTYDDWLERLVEPFTDPNVAVAYGRQRGGAKTRYSERRLFEQWFPDEPDPDQQHPFCNNANCAVRRELWLDHPYDEGLTGLEDVAWARGALAAGHRIVYVPTADVVHNHDETAGEVFNRYRREGMAFRQIFPEENCRFGDCLRLTGVSMWRDWVSAWEERQFAEVWRDIVVFRSAQYWGTFRGCRFHGKVESTLKRKLYYPPPRRGTEANRAEPERRKIPYRGPTGIAP